MITSWDIYWITRLDGICDFFSTISILLIIAVVGIIVARLYIDNWTMTDTEKKFMSQWKKATAILTAASVVMGLLSCFIPSTKDACAIYLIPKIANNEQIQKLPDNAAKLLNAQMEEWINDTFKENKDTK